MILSTKDQEKIKIFEKEDDARKFAQIESGKYLKSEFCVYNNSTQDMLLHTKNGILGIDCNVKTK